MGRAGSGGSSGHHSAGGVHSSGRTSGVHHPGGSSSSGSHHRAGAGRGNFGGGSLSSRESRSGRVRNDGYMRSGPGMPPPPPRRGPGMPPPPPSRDYGYRRSTGGNGLGCGGTIVTVILIIAILAIVGMAMGGSSSSSSGGSSNQINSTIQRTKIDTKDAYIDDCIVDELDWFDNEARTGAKLKEFWEETGVQPYIVLKAYDPELSDTDDDQVLMDWAEDYYDSHFDSENVFLYVYFAEFDADNEVGNMAFANGKETSSVMDAEAREIFFNNLDLNWYSDMSTDDLFVTSFNDTAKTIMKVHTSKFDVMKMVLVLAVVVVIGLVLINLVKQKNQRAKEKAEEERRILETPIGDMATSDLESKYLQK